VRERFDAASPGAAALRFDRRAGGILRGTARARLEGEVFSIFFWVEFLD
jgi:hypothetical protein